MHEATDGADSFGDAITAAPASAAALRWSAQLESGLAEVDDQHRHLIGLVNALGQARTHGAAPDQLLAVIGELREYTHRHFQAEADLMQAWPVNTANRTAHLRAHRGFIEHLEKASQLIACGTSGAIVDHLLAFLVKWLVHHISGVDARMAKEILGLRSATLGIDAAESIDAIDTTESPLYHSLIDIVSELYDSVGLHGFELLELNRRLETELEQRKRAEQRERNYNRVLELLAAKSPLATVLDAIARNVEAANPDMLCSILLLNEEGTHLRYGAAPSLPEFYRLALHGLALDADAAFCGAAAFAGKRVIVGDIESHVSRSPLLDLARRAQLGAGWLQPIVAAQGRVRGLFGIYYRESRRPSPADLQLIEEQARLAALAIDRTADEARLQLAASVFRRAHEGIMITDTDGTIIEINEAFTVITGYNRAEALGQNSSMLHSSRQPVDYDIATRQALLENGHWSGEIWNRRKSGEVYAALVTMSTAQDGSGNPQHYVALFTDITPMKEYQRQLEHLVHYDVLTGLPNRVLLADRLQQALVHSQRRSQSLAIVYLDLDGFKEVNDSHGHDVGDELLITLAQRMKLALREGDTLARIGGDEFIAVLVDLEQWQDCKTVLLRLLQAASAPVSLRRQTLHVSASMGVTLYPQDGADSDQLIRHADQAMYLAKQAGKNCYHLFDVVQDTAMKVQQESLEHIHGALERREFVLHYQPKVNMKTGAVIGVEALIRWQHPKRGLLFPAAFLPLIEDHPLSVDLGEWVINAALAQIDEWRAAGLDIPISVNIGARQLQQADFMPRLLSLLAAHPEVQPCCLELEILETSTLEDVARASDVMRACRAIGVRFALDDFGTGYSSLVYLKRLPVDMLKIDQSFVRDMIDNPEDLAIIEATIGLATAFRRRVIAEGLETVAHGERLLSLGCELAQGYGIARPMPASELPVWAANWRPDIAWTTAHSSA